MDLSKMRRSILCFTAMFFITSLPPLSIPAAETDKADIQSYSKGPEYEFKEDESASGQLQDVFTTLDLQSATISSLQEEMEKGNLTSEMLTGMYIDRIRAYDTEKDLNSIIWINENALSEAKALDAERASGRVRGKLHGIPIIVKDNYNVAGMPTSAGATALADFIVEEDAGAVKKLKDAGAIIIAKANLSEFAKSAIDSHSTLGGDAHNAFDTDRSPAGSSGGTATAVASNFGAAGLGTDTGGSIRNPSSWSDLYGIRPSKGLTSIAGVFPLQASRDTTGPMTRNAEDLAIVLEAMSGNDDEDDYTVEADADALLGDGYTDGLDGDSLKGKRIGFLRSSFDYYAVSINRLNELIEEKFGIEGYFSEKESDLPSDIYLTTEVNALSRQARATLRKAGAEFVDLSEKEGLSDEELFMMRWVNTANSSEYDINKYLSEYGGESSINTLKELLDTGENIGYIEAYMKSYIENYDSLADSFDKDDYENYGYIAYGEKGYLRSYDWEDVLDLREKIADVMEENDVDAIMYMYFTNISKKQDDDYFSCNNSNYDRDFGPALGLPDINIPMGFITEDGADLPMGLSLVGKFGGEKELLEIAYAYEKEAGDRIKKNPEITPALRDERLNSFLDALMEESAGLNPAKYGYSESSSVIRKLENAYEKALNADYDDPCSVYDAAYELATAYDKVTYEYLEKKKNAGTVLIKGQKLKNISSGLFNGVEGINSYGSEDKKTASVSKKGLLKGKNPGKTIINALNAKDKKNVITLSSCTVTVISRPKLDFKEGLSSEDAGKIIDGFDAFVSDDIELLEPDKWKSSKKKVAEVDSDTGKITIKGKGKTRITAYFGNVKVKGTLEVR